MKTANEDHQQLRSTTKETITNEDELTDFGLQLGCPLSLIKQKRSDYPRNIAMASFEMVVDWWDTWGNTREENYKKVVGALRSINKNCAAQRLEKNLGLRNSNPVLDRTSTPERGRQHPLTKSANNEIDNNNAIVSGRAGIAGLESGRSNLAICDAVTNPDGNSGSLEGDAGGVNIIEITDEEHSIQEQFSRRNSCEIQYTVEHEAVDIFEGSPTSVKFHESEMTDRPTDTTHLDSSANGQPAFASNSHETEMKVNIFQLKGPVSSKWTSTSVKFGENKLNICESSDSYVPMYETIPRSDSSPEDLEVFGQAGTETENIESPRLSKLSREVDVNDFGEPVRSVKNSEQLPNSDVWFDGSQSEDRLLRNAQDSSEKGNFRKGRFQARHEEIFERLESDVEDNDSGASVSVQSPLLDKTRRPSHTIDIGDPEVVDRLLPEVHISNAQSHDVMFQKPSVNMAVNGQTVKMNGQTGTVNGQTGKLNDQTCVDIGQTGAANGLTDRRNNEAGVVNGEISEVVDQKGVVNSQTSIQIGQRGTENSQTCKSSPQSQKINIEDPEVVHHLLPEVHISNAQSQDVMFQKPSVNVTVGGQTGVVNGQTGVVNGQTGAVNGQTGVDNRQTCIVDDQIGVADDQTGVCAQNGQRSAENRQTGVVNGKVIEQKKDESKKRSSGFLYRIYRRLFRRKRTVAANEADAELGVHSRSKD